MNTYLKRYAYKEQQLFSELRLNTNIIVVIPCFNEPDIISSLNSLVEAQPPSCYVEVIVVVNQAENIDKHIDSRNKNTILEIKGWEKSQTSGWLSIEIIKKLDLPPKHAGVGLARKIGMDEAIRRFESLKSNGIIVCFDADSLAESNYFTAIEQHFKNHPNSPACSIHYEHPLSGNYSADIYLAIINYELHLRYYVWAQRYAGHPFAFQTIGSSMAVRSNTYQSEGGMNRRKAGEDFYFLHKLIPLGGFSELTKTKVIPSPRISNRVPFGTGKAVNDFVEKEKEYYDSYALSTFTELKVFFDRVNTFYHSDPTDDLKTLPNTVQEFLASINAQVEIQEIRRQSTSQSTFRNRFFRWFDGFVVMKFAHFVRDNHYPNEPIHTSSMKLLELLDIKVDSKISTQGLLEKYRELDRQSKFAG